MKLTSKLDPADFTIKNIFKRLDKQGDLWKPIFKQKVDIKKVFRRNLGLNAGTVSLLTAIPLPGIIEFNS